MEGKERIEAYNYLGANPKAIGGTKFFVKFHIENTPGPMALACLDNLYTCGWFLMVDVGEYTRHGLFGICIMSSYFTQQLII